MQHPGPCLPNREPEIQFWRGIMGARAGWLADLGSAVPAAKSTPLRIMQMSNQKMQTALNTAAASKRLIKGLSNDV